MPKPKENPFGNENQILTYNSADESSDNEQVKKKYEDINNKKDELRSQNSNYKALNDDNEEKSITPRKRNNRFDDSKPPENLLSSNSPNRKDIGSVNNTEQTDGLMSPDKTPGEEPKGFRNDFIS